MGVLEDIMHALDRIPIWKRVSALPKEVDELRKRVPYDKPGKRIETA